MEHDLVVIINYFLNADIFEKFTAHNSSKNLKFEAT